jgi:hypothetical protein
MGKSDREIVFPMAVAWRARIIGNHWRAALRRCESRDDTQDENRS